jgi:hypothetical protein
MDTLKVKRSGSSPGGKERPLTRMTAFTLGLLFIIAPLVSPFFYENQRHDLASARIGTLLFFLATYILCAVVGTAFLLVGLKGTLPSWLAKRLNSEKQ